MKADLEIPLVFKLQIVFMHPVKTQRHALRLLGKAAPPLIERIPSDPKLADSSLIFFARRQQNRPKHSA